LEEKNKILLITVLFFNFGTIFTYTNRTSNFSVEDKCNKSKVPKWLFKKRNSKKRPRQQMKYHTRTKWRIMKPHKAFR